MAVSPYYQDDWVTIYHGDSRELLSEIDAGVMLTDPPYYGREDMFATDAVEPVLRHGLATFGGSLIFWPHLGDYPARKQPDAVHIWHKAVPIHPRSITGNVAGHHYERILSYGAGNRSEVFRVAAVLPNFAACADEVLPHPTQKPLELVRQLLGRLPAGVVLDPFMGSGTTLRAAKDIGRKAVGVDIEERYCELAAQRCAQDVIAVHEPVTRASCDCRANDWVEGDNGAVRCIQCGGYSGEPGTSTTLYEVSS